MPASALRRTVRKIRPMWMPCWRADHAMSAVKRTGKNGVALAASV